MPRFFTVRVRVHHAVVCERRAGRGGGGGGGLWRETYIKKNIHGLRFVLETSTRAHGECVRKRLASLSVVFACVAAVLGTEKYPLTPKEKPRNSSGRGCG